jgi:hypothetical protein
MCFTPRRKTFTNAVLARESCSEALLRSEAGALFRANSMLYSGGMNHHRVNMSRPKSQANASLENLSEQLRLTNHA